MTDLGIALGLYHLSPRGFARVLELPPIHLEGRLVWCLTGRGGAHEAWVLHPPLLQAPCVSPRRPRSPAGWGKGLSFQAAGEAKSAPACMGDVLNKQSPNPAGAGPPSKRLYSAWHAAA